MRLVQQQTRFFDVLLMPTSPIIPPKIKALSTIDAKLKMSGMALRNTALANFLDNPTITIPCHKPAQPQWDFLSWGHTNADGVCWPSQPVPRRPFAATRLASGFDHNDRTRLIRPGDAGLSPNKSASDNQHRRCCNQSQDGRKGKTASNGAEAVYTIATRGANKYLPVENLDRQLKHHWHQTKDGGYRGQHHRPESDKASPECSMSGAVPAATIFVKSVNQDDIVVRQPASEMTPRPHITMPNGWPAAHRPRTTPPVDSTIADIVTKACQPELN